ncbi:hypothetical protein COV18_00980 [Candidatus Woesearchaeota archaeon CG10_big_fil_rev_8_21_14_0_10_37_12]|nr:MAG: hypothetical protein COV18_00980 [Candidatus Woesearchaeota archaeon CG10_big_fil_rev_8_21_14_0_10_37_12]
MTLNSKGSVFLLVISLRFPRISDYENQIVNGKRVCRNCDVFVSVGRRHYCSDDCMLEFNQNHDWYFIRKAILKRDKYKCSICLKRSKRSNLDVDHIIPVRKGIDPFNKKNLRLLCKDCHKAKTKLDVYAGL